MDIQTIRTLLSQGETGKALEALLALLEKDSRYKGALLRALRVIEANFNAVRQQELKGILPFQEAQREYSRVNDALLAVLDDVEAGRVPVLPGTPATRRWLWLAGGGLFLLLLVAFAVWKRSEKTAGCPAYADKTALHVLILPFDNIGGIEAHPATLIRGNIQELTGKAKIPAEVKISSRRIETESFSQDAQEIGENCGADLVVYGQYLAFEKDSIRVKMGFRFLKAGGEASDSPFTTFRDITAVQPTRELQDAVFSLCAMLAIRNRNVTFAKRWMDKIHEKDAMDNQMTSWLAEQH